MTYDLFVDKHSGYSMKILLTIATLITRLPCLHKMQIPYYREYTIGRIRYHKEKRQES
jgi:hypothetical protein